MTSGEHRGRWTASGFYEFAEHDGCAGWWMERAHSPTWILLCRDASRNGIIDSLIPRTVTCLGCLGHPIARISGVAPR